MVAIEFAFSLTQKELGTHAAFTMGMAPTGLGKNGDLIWRTGFEPVFRSAWLATSDLKD